MRHKDKTKRVQMKDNKVHGEDQGVKRIITSIKKTLSESFEYEEDDFQERPHRLERGFNSGLECFPRGKQVVNRREENEFDDFDEFREMNNFNSLSLGHRKHQEKHQEKAAVDSIKESITSATNRMTQDVKDYVEDFHRAGELFPSSQRDIHSLQRGGNGHQQRTD